jgi:adenylate cyclase
VRYVIEGSLRRVGNALRANAQLVSSETGVHLWADRFDVESGEFGAGQDEIVRRLAAALGMEMVQIEAARSARERSTDPDAFDLILRAQALENQPRNLERDAGAQALYERALQLDPSSAWVMASLAMTQIRQRLNRAYSRDGSEKQRVARLVADAQAIAPIAEPSLAAAASLHEVEGRYHEAMATAQRLIEVNPNNHNGYIFLARNKIYTGRAEQAIPRLTKALQINPRDPSKFDRFWRMGYALLMIERYDESIVWQQRSAAAFPDAPGAVRASRFRMMAVAHALSGRIDDARRAIDEAKRIWPFCTIRGFFPKDLTSVGRVAQVQRFQDGLRIAGARDHADEAADFGARHDNELRALLAGFTPTHVPGARTIRSADLDRLLADHDPIILDCAGQRWGRSIPGAIALQDAGVGGSLTDGTQDRLRRKLRELTDGARRRGPVRPRRSPRGHRQPARSRC